jgi:hypothetical protein
MRNHPATRLRSTALTALAVILLGLPACNGAERQGAIQLARGAASKVFGSVGRETGEIKAAASEVDTMASRYGASAEEVSAVAGTADNYQGWTVPQQSVDRIAALARDVKNDKVVSAGVGVACDWMSGKITDPATFQNSVASAAVGMAASDAYSFREATNDLAGKLAGIRSQGSSQDKAAAAWLCYAYQVVPVK